MNRAVFIERALRQIYGGFPTDDSTITTNLVNTWLEDAAAVAAKQNYKDNLTIDGINYVNNSFYTTFKGLSVTKDENFLWKIELPSIPLGIGTSEGISTLVFKDPSNNQISYPGVWLSQNQVSYQRGMRSIPNKVLIYSEGKYVYALSTLALSAFTATATMISAGDSTDLNSELNVPSDYFPVMVEYIKQQLMFERSVPVDGANDGRDAIKDA